MQDVSKKQTNLASCLKVETVCPSETSVNFCHIARGHITEYNVIHGYDCENLKSDLSDLKVVYHRIIV